MSLRLWLLRALYAMPRIRGRDRLISYISDGLVMKPFRLSDGLSLLLEPAEYVQLEIIINGANEPRTLQLIRKLVQPGDCVIDVGAHIGHHALHAARAARSNGCVYAIDPQPYNADRISRNATINCLDNVVTICAAAGDTDGFVQLPMQSERDRSRLSLRGKGPNDLTLSVEVPIRRLDSLIQSHNMPAPKLIKIDVEGFELEVLRGLGSRIDSCQNIILELLDGTDGDLKQRIVELLQMSGFQLRQIDGAPWKSGEKLIESNLWAAR